MAVDEDVKFCKWMLIIINTLLLSVGIAMLTHGLWLRSKDDIVTTMIESGAFVNGVTFLITLGPVLLAVVLFGGFSAYNESRRALQVFAVLLAFLAASLTVLGVLAYTRSDKAKVLQLYTTLYYDVLAEEDPANAAALTLFHREFHCCGFLGGFYTPPSGEKVKNFWEPRLGGFELDAAKQTCPKPSTDLDVVLSCPAAIANAIWGGQMVMAIFLAIFPTDLMCTIILIGKLQNGSNRVGGLPLPELPELCLL